MKKVLFVYRFAGLRGYEGGVISMINHLFGNINIFNSEGYDIEAFDYIEPLWVRKLPSKIRNVFYGFFQKRALGAKIKKERDPLIHIHTSREFLFLKDLIVAKYLHKRYNSRIILTIHVGKVSTVFHRISYAQNWCIKTINKHIAKIIFLSKEMKQVVVDLGVAEEKCEVLYNFHNLKALSNFLPQSESKKLKLLFVGAIHREKGILELLKAVQELADYDISLDICGNITDASIEQEFNHLITKLKDHVRMLGYVKNEEKTRVFEESDVLILPSYHEGFPLVVLEGMAAACALIATPVGALPEVLTDNMVTWVSVGSVSDIVKAIKKFYDDRAMLETLKKNNLSKSHAYTLEEHIKQTCRIYRSI